MRTPNLLLTTLTTIFLFCLAPVLSAQHYWVGGSGEWTDYANHWATSSGGNTFHTAAPTEIDDVYFDANSFTEGGQTVTLNENNIACRSMDWTGVQNFPAVEQFDYEALWIYGSLTLSADMTCNFAVIDFRSDEDGNTITSNGSELGNQSIIRTNGTGSWTLVDALSCDQIQMSQGTFATNGNTVNVAGMFSLNGTMAKTIDLADSDFHCGQWRTWGSANTITGGDYTIHTDAMYADEDGTGPYTYNNITFDNEGCIMEGGGIFNAIDISSTAGGWVQWESGYTFTVNDIVGTTIRHEPFDFRSSSPGDEATIEKTSGSIDLEYIILQDVHANGGASFNADNCLDMGNNNGWNITDIVPWSFYWVGDSGDWEDVSHWSDVSGGAPAYSDMPSRFDHVYVDGNSFSMGGQTIMVNQPVDMASIDCSGVTNNPTLDAPYGNRLHVYGDVNFTDDVNKVIHSVNFIGNGTHDAYVGTQGSISYPNFWGDGSYTLLSDVTCATFLFAEGTLDLNMANVYCTFDFREQSDSNDELFMGGGVISCRNFQIQGSGTVHPETAKVICRDNFYGNGLSYYHVALEDEPTIHDSNTMQYLEFFPAVIAKLEAGATQTVNAQIFATGFPDAPISISSTVDGEQATISLSSGTVDGTYLILKDNAATGGATFNADQSIDNGNVTGWNITEIVPLDFYWVGGTGDWSDAANHWATTSGGNEFHNFAPSVLDDVYFDANSFNADGQIVTLDVDIANLHDLDWTGVTNNPHFEGNLGTINVYGSLIYSDQMSSSIQNFNFLSTESEIIDPGFDGSPGTNSYFHFNSSGTWTLASPLTCRTLTLEAGTFITNDNDCHIDFSTYFLGDNQKVLDLGSSEYYTRSMSWNTPTGSNLDLLAGSSDMIVSSSFTPGLFGQGDNINLEFNNLQFTNDIQIDVGSISTDVVLNNLVIDAGKTVEIWNTTLVEVNQLTVVGTVDNPIILKGMNDGIQAVISQAAGTVDGFYLELQDISGTGGADFYANNSINNGNVSGWIFTGQAQTISFDPLDDVLEDVGSFDISATATSGLDVAFEVLSGPATIDGTTVTITGAGPVTIQASQDGDAEYNPAPSISHTFCSNPLQPTVTGTLMGDYIELVSSSDTGNQWYVNGDPITDATEVTFDAYQNGVYTVVVDIDGCSSQASDDYSIIDLSVDSEGLSNWAVYPNPGNGIINFGGVEAGSFIQIFNQTGQLVKAINITQKNSLIDISDLPSGLYHLMNAEGNHTQYLLAY